MEEFTFTKLSELKVIKEPCYEIVGSFHNKIIVKYDKNCYDLGQGLFIVKEEKTFRVVDKDSGVYVGIYHSFKKAIQDVNEKLQRLENVRNGDYYQKLWRLFKEKKEAYLLGEQITEGEEYEISREG